MSHCRDRWVIIFFILFALISLALAFALFVSFIILRFMNDLQLIYGFIVLNIYILSSILSTDLIVAISACPSQHKYKDFFFFFFFIYVSNSFNWVIAMISKFVYVIDWHHFGSCEIFKANTGSCGSGLTKEPFRSYEMKY